MIKRFRGKVSPLIGAAGAGAFGDGGGGRGRAAVLSRSLAVTMISIRRSVWHAGVNSSHGPGRATGCQHTACTGRYSRPDVTLRGKYVRIFRFKALRR